MPLYKSSEDEAKKMRGMFAVNPKKDCPHVESLVTGIEMMRIDITLPCGVCGNVGENWLCLKCSGVYCSRYVHEHMVHHNNRNPTHHIVLSFSDLYFWCYACDSYIDSPHLESILQAATMAKFNTTICIPKLKYEDSAYSDPQELGAFHLKSGLEKEKLLSRMRAVIYGNCIGDAIGLLTEFMTKKEAQEIYGTVKEKKFLGFGKESKKNTPVEKLELEYPMKHEDLHRLQWQIGDWTDDSDQMILILRTLLDNDGKVDILDFAQKLLKWIESGYKELGDLRGIGIEQQQIQALKQEDFSIDPHKVWAVSGRWAASNGGVMRTSILGIQDFGDIPIVIENTRQICKVTHADPRCIASCVAVTTAIALMLQGKHCKGNGYDEKAICEAAYEFACAELKTFKEKEELRKHMFAKTLSDLELSGDNKIGYTYKCLGAGFWAFRQKDFRSALTELVMEAGDADANGAVAGALLGCKLGVEHLPETWLNGLQHREWLDEEIDRLICKLETSHNLLAAQRGAIEETSLGSEHITCALNQMELRQERPASYKRLLEQAKTEKRLHRSGQRSSELEASLEAERQVREKKERRLQSSEHRSCELERCLAAETEVREETERRLRRSRQRSSELETSLAAERQAKEETERQLHSSERRSHELESSLAAERQAKEETERQLHSSEHRSHELETSLAAQTQANEETEGQLHSSEQRSRELETTLAAVQQELEESLRSNEPSCDWILDRNEISLSDTEIGIGAWGRVVEGTFGGCKVAVKELHQSISLPPTRRLFEREMNIASKCRHPCLLQFIGATNDDQSPLFVTELLDTNLRAVLYERALKPFELTTIALDVAKGLNYLHLKRPSPIVHRDISSGNVLLWKKGANWRAKVSDYGSANFLQTMMTACPGAVIYSAPEAHTPQQSPKVDVYSFGVLLCEMNIREMPDVNKRNQQIVRVTNTFYRRLIRRCTLLQNFEERPSMAEIIEEIENSE